MWEDEWNSKKVENAELRRRAPLDDFSKCVHGVTKVLNLPAKKRGYCHTCSCLFNIKDEEKHKKHDSLIGISDHHIRHPSEMLKQLECSKKEAQYMFSVRSVDFVYNTLRELNVGFVVCIGAPRIHERISGSLSSNCMMRSVLLDIDERYYSFYSSGQFFRYNMFSNYFFGGDVVRETFLGSIRNERQKVAIVIDPPFGGRVEPLAFTLQCLQKLREDCNSSLDGVMPVLWAFPYFMEPYIRGSCPDFTMLDYKIEYVNHSSFKAGGNKRGSPVRIFTNVPAGKISLPEAEGYRYCSFCDRWVAPENKHCKMCNYCTSKDGRTYKHCKTCGRCVKPTYIHCSDCGRCCLPKHKCGLNLPRPVACFCGSLNHLAKECPLRRNNSKECKPQKRKICETKQVTKKKCSPRHQPISCKDSKKKRFN
ncbi:rRNA N6-adenosine-methyltransferase ZCCHC4 isoform X2 [Ischnura elegans]|nr:rRNA N6-adenosine-methyltransferase ZCCHC4 isoform X2 [Ischnura elegans]